MRGMGLGETLIRKIAHGNWLRLLERTWGDLTASASLRRARDERTR
jgi:hypothetical protein